jgi:RNA polymerase sigma-70 factor (sigma-E family)
MNETTIASGPPSYDERFDALATLSYQVAYRMVGSREDARDIAQEVMARAYARWPKVRDKAGGWVAKVTTNLALDHLRRRSRIAPAAVDASRDDAALVAERSDLVAALRRLPRRQRDVVVLRYLADLPEAEVASTLGCSTGTVKQHAHRGLATLRTSLDLTIAALDGDAAIDPDAKGAA